MSVGFAARLSAEIPRLEVVNVCYGHFALCTAFLQERLRRQVGAIYDAYSLFILAVPRYLFVCRTLTYFFALPILPPPHFFRILPFPGTSPNNVFDSSP